MKASQDDERRPGQGAATSESAGRLEGMVPVGTDNGRKARRRTPTVEWSSNGAAVTVGRFPLSGIGLDLGAGVIVKITGSVLDLRPGGPLVAEAGATVTITGRLGEDATLWLRGAP